jgi:hypothetical protein
MGAFDLLGGGSGGMFGDLLTPEQKQALAYRGLMAAAGAFGQAAMPSRMPIPIGAALGQAAAAMGDAQDTAGYRMLQGAELAAKAQLHKSQVDLANAAMKDEPPSMFGAGGTSAIPQTSTTAPATGAGQLPISSYKTASGNLTPGQIKWLVQTVGGYTGDDANTAAAIILAESSGNPGAIGDNGESFGLSQVHRPVWGQDLAMQALQSPEGAVRAMRLISDKAGVNLPTGPHSKTAITSVT